MYGFCVNPIFTLLPEYTGVSAFVIGVPSVSTTGGLFSSDQENLIRYLPFDTSSQGVGLSVDLFGFLSLLSAHLRQSSLSSSSLEINSSPTIAFNE